MARFCDLICVSVRVVFSDRAVLKITEEEFSRPPVDVMMQLLLGLALCMWAGVSVPAKFVSVLPHSEENR